MIIIFRQLGVFVATARPMIGLRHTRSLIATLIQSAISSGANYWASASRGTFISLLPIILGTTSFLLVVGPRVVDVSNIAWLGSGDPAQQFLGWEFFRKWPWSFPVGLNPNYGLEISNSIVFSDSNPLLALAFKPFSPLLPEPFQYFGLWVYVSFVLQAWFGYKLTRLFSDRLIVCLLGAGLFVFSPPMIGHLQRPQRGDLNQVAHFLLLAALYLCFRQSQKNHGIAWACLLTVAALVHAYILAMVALLWLADLLGLVFRREQPTGYAVQEVLAVTALVGLMCWQAGYFSAVGEGLPIPSSYGHGHAYGYYRMNMLSLFDSSGWSYLLKDLPEAGGDYEGFNFLGSGVILALLFAVLGLIKSQRNLLGAIGKRPALLVAMFCLTAFALSNKLGIGSATLELPLPEIVLRAAAIFRASGRMFWPVFYALVVSIVYVIVRSYGNRATVAILAVALTVQIVDTSAGWRVVRNQLATKPAKTWPTPLKDAFWEQAATRYRKVRWVMPPEEKSPDFPTFASYAARYGLGTDAVYLNRISGKQLQDARANALAALETGSFEQDSLYILDPNIVAEAARHLDQSSDLLAQIDGFNVLALGWKTCQECSHSGHEIGSPRL
jgi:Family of unknown function (DUF6311)